MRQTHRQKRGADLSTVAGRTPFHWLTERTRMTSEELEQMLERQSQQLSDLEAEVASLREENKKLLEDNTKKDTELQETKKLNFTLARQVDRMPAKSDLEILNEIL